MLDSLFLNLCPNCGGKITSERLFTGLPCEKCVPDEGNLNIDELEGELFAYLKKARELESWTSHFELCINSKPWSLQTAWAKRVLLGRSFALLAPTGVGKTSFGLVTASYLYRKGLRSYIIVPTVILLKQVQNLLGSFGVHEDDLLVFGGEIGRKQNEINRERLKRGAFKILLTTSAFLYKNYQSIPKDFNFIFVDDVDSFLKTARNIDKALLLLGFEENDIQEALHILLLRRKPTKTQEDMETLRSWSDKVREISKKRNGVLVVSSATSNPKSYRIELFKELLGFEVGSPTFYLRNVEDLYDDFNRMPLEEWIRMLGKGGLIFLSAERGRRGVEETVKSLRSSGIRAVSYEEIDDFVIKDYERGDIDVFVGIASFRNPLARGFDLPHVIRYAIFYGVPKIVISLKIETNPVHLLWALYSLRKYLAKKHPEKLKVVDSYMKKLKKIEKIEVSNSLPENPQIKTFAESLYKEVLDFLTSPEVLNLMRSTLEINLRQTSDGFEMIISDATGYLQASGRTSRMYAGGITKGLSLVLVDDESAFHHLRKKIRWFNDEIEFKSVEKVNLNDLLKLIDRDREILKKFREGKIFAEKKEVLKPVLIIVESPNKAKTIANFFGRPVRRRVENHDLLETSVDDKYLMITASLGHVLDLNKEQGYHGTILSEKVVPLYEIIPGKEGIVSSLRSMAMEAEEVLIATDPDTEGEKIAWDLYGILRSYTDRIKRMEFHEVTRKAILYGMRNPRDINLNLVKAQIVRRIADRWVGFDFSEYLQDRFRKKNLSAGRVQTPVLGWIIEREKKFNTKIYKVQVSVAVGDKQFKLEFTFKDKTTANRFFFTLKEVEIYEVEEKVVDVNSAPPYRTDTMLQEASRKLKYSLTKTMNLAQDLFELGYITYHRTDSVRVSDAGRKIAEEIIKEDYGLEYFFPRTWSEEGAHECIRPTKALDPEDLKSLILTGEVQYLTTEHVALYELIFNRFIASQMRPVRVREKLVKVRALDKEQDLSLRVEILLDGWNRLVPLDIAPDVRGIIDVTSSKRLKIVPEAFPYTQGELVLEMKEKGIGRPSTYASIIEKLFEREYIVERKGYIFPTELGKRVYRFLTSKEKIKEFLSEDFTRELESLMDKVEEGKVDFQEVLLDIYEKLEDIKRMFN